MTETCFSKVLTLETLISTCVFSSLSSHISYGTAWENLFKRQNISSLAIISIILMTCIFDQAVIFLGEIRYWSLLGVKGLIKTS